MFYGNYERLCREAGSNPSAIAMQAGLARSTASSWKMQGTIPKQEVLNRLAEVLGCNVADFFQDNSDNSVTIQNSTVNSNNYRRCEDETELLQLYRSLPSRKARLRFLLEAYEIAEKITGDCDE